jgi:hypothetical protein
MLMRKFAIVLTGLMFLAASLAAQDKGAEKPVKKKAKERAKAKVTAGGEEYTVVSVDADAKTIRVRDAEGKQSTLNISASTQIKGPRGGKTPGLTDKRLVPGAKIRVIRGASGVTEVYLPTQARQKGKATKTDTKKAKDKTATEEKKVDEKPKERIKEKVKRKAKDKTKKAEEEKKTEDKK